MSAATSSLSWVPVSNIQACQSKSRKRAILILVNVRAGQGNANWSARVMFHEDVYTGRWWETNNKEHDGTIAGTISRD